MSTERRKAQKRAAQKRYRMSHLEKCRTTEGAWHSSNYPRYRRRLIWTNLLKKWYGLSRKDYDRMILTSQGKCNLCNKICTKRDLAIDHNHQSGQVRGLLCSRCNTSLSVLENPQWMSKAQVYLKGF